MPDELSRWQVFWGCVLALALSAIGFLISIPLAFELGDLLRFLGLKGGPGDWIFPVTFAPILLVALLLATKKKRSGLRQGLIIGFSLVFLFNTTCWGFMYFR